MSEKTRLGLAALALLCAAACGGGGGDDDDDSSGVDPDQTLAEASDQELMDVCEWYLDQFTADDVTRLGCYIAAITLSEGGEEDCETLAQDCLDDAEDGTINLGGCVADQSGDLPDCAADVTVGDYEACLGAQATQVTAIAGDISCETSSDELLDVLDFGAQPECEPVEETCPELLENDG